MLQDEFLWVEKYRPHTVEDTILNKDLKRAFQEFVNSKEVPNIILEGPAGCGKTTIAKAVLDEIGADYIEINASLDRNIDTLRNEIQQFASSVSMMGGRKYVILDEADHLNPNSMQPALRNFIEKFSKNCGFIMTCNYVHKIIEPLQSRCSVISFKIKASDLPSLASQILKRSIQILDQEGIEYEKAAVAEVVKKFMPDWRRVLNELQRYGKSGKIDSGILVNVQQVSIDGLIKFLKEKDFTNMRRWVGENLDGDEVHLYRQIYDQASKYLTKNSVPLMVVTLGRYQYQSAFVADAEINTVACLTELMLECEFK